MLLLFWRFLFLSVLFVVWVVVCFCFKCIFLVGRWKCRQGCSEAFLKDDRSQLEERSKTIEDTESSRSSIVVNTPVNRNPEDFRNFWSMNRLGARQSTAKYLIHMRACFRVCCLDPLLGKTEGPLRVWKPAFNFGSWRFSRFHAVWMDNILHPLVQQIVFVQR